MKCKFKTTLTGGKKYECPRDAEEGGDYCFWKFNVIYDVSLFVHECCLIKDVLLLHNSFLILCRYKSNNRS